MTKSLVLQDQLKRERDDALEELQIVRPCVLVLVLPECHMFVVSVGKGGGSEIERMSTCSIRASPS